jgi:tetratricopeptide (TPR) repeat protein
MLSIARVLTFWGVLVGVAASPRLATAEDELLVKLPKVTEPTARAHLQAGNAHYRVREFEAALAEYKKGILIEDAAIFLYNIGQCHRKLEHWADAVWVYQRFLDRAKPEPALVARVEGLISEAQNHVDEEKRAQAGQTPSSRPSSAPVASTPSPAPGNEAPRAPVPSTRLVRGDPWYNDGVGWALTGGGAIGLGLGGLLLFSAADLENQADATTIQADRRSLQARASTRRIEGGIVGVGGAALLTLGIIKLIIHPEDREEPIVRLGITSNGIAISGRF